MKTKIIEATNGRNYGKFLLGVFDDSDWAYASKVLPGGVSMLRSIGQGFSDVLVFDLQTCEGAIFTPGGSAHYDLQKHRIWCCPMFEYFLGWLYEQNRAKISLLDLPDLVNLQTDFFSFSGYRRNGEASDSQMMCERIIGLLDAAKPEEISGPLRTRLLQIIGVKDGA